MIKTIRKFFFKTVISYLRLKYFFKDTLKAGSPSHPSNSSFLNTTQYFFKGLNIQLKSYFDNQLKTAIAFTGKDISQEALTYPQSIRLVLSYYLNLPVLQGYGKKTQIDKYSALDLSWFQTIQCFIEGLTLQIKDYFNQKFDLTSFVLYSIENDYADDDKIINIMDSFPDEQGYHLVAALINSANEGSIKSVGFLLENKVFHNSVLAIGLQNASAAGHAEIVKLFLAEGTRRMSTQNLIVAAKNSLNLAGKNDHADIIKLILEQIRTECTDAIRSSDWGRLMNYYRTAREMIDDATINSMFKNAVFENQQYMVELMLDDQDVNQEEITNALEHAALSGFDNVLKLLLPKFFPYNPETYEQPRHKALSIASSKGHVGAVTILLKEITHPVAIKDALWYAQENDRDEVIALLTAKQATLDKSENNQDGSETPLQQRDNGNTPSLGEGSLTFLPGSSVFVNGLTLGKRPPLT